MKGDVRRRVKTEVEVREWKGGSGSGRANVKGVSGSERAEVKGRMRK